MEKVIMGKLTLSKVEELSNREGVRKIAVENFLITVDANKYKHYALANLDYDARLYKWNAKTVKAIKDGIKLAFAG